ncbi:two-component regulator propeller domain-containing protein [Dokdonella sp.]|uniref:two-component regulator propeller domain-containing protein n=1 Tax=Dokdonella sp. TaxID=2291710 RepID=UPI0039C87992
MLVGALAAHASETPSPPALHDYAVERWTTVEGLPHNSIRGIAQTPEGHLWFGTWEGLVSYNGLEFVVLDRASKPGLLDNGIGALYRDRKGELWISDSRGNVGHRDADGILSFSPRPAELPKVLIQAMTMDRKGTLWLLYESKGLGSLDADGNFHSEPPAPDSPLRMANRRMVVDRHDRLWIGSFGGLLYRDIDGDDVTRHVGADFGLPEGLAWPYVAADGQLWIAAGDSLYRMEQGRPVFKHRVPDKGRLTAMLEDRKGQLWLGTENQGLFRLTDHFGLERMADNLNLPGGRITDIFEDAEDSVWVGANGGLFRLRETLFRNVTMRDGLSGNYIRAVMEDTRGQLWIASSGGLDRMDTDGSLHAIHLPTTSGNPTSVLSLAEDHQGRLWIGTYVDGLYRLDPNGKIQHFDERVGLPAGNIRAIAIDSDDVAWLATQRGVASLRDGQVQRVKGENAPSGLTTALDSQPGELWIGTIEGARVLRGDQIQRIDLDALGGGRSVFGFRRLGEDMWIISDRGLYRYRNGELARVGLEQGMPVDATFQMVADNTGHLWITSNRGVMRTTHAALDAVADGRSTKIELQRYNEMDGMISSQANGASGPAAWLRRDGSLWIATSSGLSNVDPARLASQSQRPSPPTVIESLRLQAQPLPLGNASQGISLPGGKRVSVGYVGLSFVLPERIVYRTRLDGLDKGWIERGRQRNVDFIGLGPGDYALHVAARHPGGPWGKSEALWRFHIEPFWWQRLSVRLLAALIALGVLLGGYLLLLRRYRSSNLRLTRLVNERTEDLQHQAARLLLADKEKSTLLDQLRVQSEAFEKQAREDVLTGLPNRRVFDESLGRALARAREGDRPVSLAMLDVDHFKKVNDQHSHGIGDAVLREVGRLLSGASRVSDVPARIGGEEFALLFHDTTLEQAQIICERLRQRFHDQRNWAGVAGLQINFSAGLVQWNGEPETEEAMLQRADDALYQAKQEGRDRICLG